MKFEVLCLDTDGTVECKSERTFYNALMANDSLLGDAAVNKETGELEENARGISIRIVQFSTDKILTGDRYSVAYTMSVNCESIEVLDEFRICLVDYIKKIGFSNVRILVDDVSMKYAEKLYPILYKLENKVRTFVVNFFLKNLGPKWVDFALPSNVLEKIKNRQGNDKIFVASKKIKSDVGLIDFDDLGKILYNEDSVFSLRKADNVTVLIKKITEADNLETLKAEVLQGNFNKYFKDCFVQKDFQTKWTDLYYFRNKIAHNGSLSKIEVDECEKTCDDIGKIIDGAYETLDTFKLSASDQETLMQAVNEHAGESRDMGKMPHDKEGYVAITEEDLFHELREAKNKLPYVGLRYFVMSWLGSKGYDYDASFTLINYLTDKGIISMNPIDENGHSTTVIDLL
ncbi:MAG: hypothetical protein J6O04_03760 [Selenomonadaceae bacterium]|nr:hypothetical protein [Selenomonadaceae bacterium]